MITFFFDPVRVLWESPKDLISDGLKKYDVTHVCVIGFKPPRHSTHRRTGLPILHWDIILQCKNVKQEKQEHHTSSDKHEKHGKPIYIHVEHVANRPEGFPPDRKDLPIFVDIYESEVAFRPGVPSELCFVFPISTKESQKGLTAHALTDLFDRFKYSKYRYSAEKGTGCLYWCKCILSDMIASEWFEKSEMTREELGKLDKITSGTVIGGKYYISGGIGKFEKEHSEPNLKLQD